MRVNRFKIVDRRGRRLIAATAAFIFSLNTAPTTWADETLALSLGEAQRRAVEENDLLRSSAQEVEKARAGVMQSWSAFAPSLRLSERAVRSDDAVNAFGFRLKQERFEQADFAIDRLNTPSALSNYQTMLEVQQPIFSAGSGKNGRRQALASARSAESNFVFQSATLRQQTAVVYWDLVLAKSALATVRQSAEAAAADAAIVEMRYGEGTALSTEQLSAQLRALEAEVAVETARDNVSAANEGLSLLLGLNVDVQVEPTQELALQTTERNFLTNGLSLEQALEAAQQRADLRAMTWSVKAAERGVGVARAAYWPQLNAFARASLDSDAPLERQGESWTLGAVILWQLPDPSSIANTRLAKAQKTQAQAEQAFLQADIERQVRRAWRAVQTARQIINARARAADLASERRRVVGLQYREGMATATELLDARAQMARAQLAHLGALRDLRVGLAKLQWTIGDPLDIGQGE